MLGLSYASANAAMHMYPIRSALENVQIISQIICKVTEIMPLKHLILSIYQQDKSTTSNYKTAVLYARAIRFVLASKRLLVEIVTDYISSDGWVLHLPDYFLLPDVCQKLLCPHTSPQKIEGPVSKQAILLLFPYTENNYVCLPATLSLNDTKYLRGSPQTLRCRILFNARLSFAYRI